MTSTDLKDLERLFKICRKQGVTEIHMDDLHIKFGDLPTKESGDQSDEIPTDELTPEQLMFYASEGRT
jgi:hypothetical protein